MLSQGLVADPRVIHGPLAPPGVAETGHAIANAGKWPLPD